MNNRLDIRRCGVEGVNRLIAAILKSAYTDWMIYAKIVNKNDKKKSDLAIYELKQIINFIQSNLFLMYTNGNCPQRDCIDGLIRYITNKKAKEELSTYALINEQRWVKKENKTTTSINK